jgi:hypothetical protein
MGKPAKMTTTFKSLLDRGRSYIGGESSQDRLVGFSTAPEGHLFPKVDPAVDGDDCDHDCGSCTIKLPRKWSIDETDELYGHVKGWATHVIVGTGKSDWKRDVEDEKGSVMQAINKCVNKPSNGVSIESSFLGFSDADARIEAYAFSFEHSPPRGPAYKCC